jgi:hypothetical protein
MKLPLFALASLFTVSAFAAPELPVEKAVALANQHIKERGAAGSTYITSVKLESGRRWAFVWSEPIAIDALKKETGLMIDMDGGIVSIVKGPPNKDPVTGKFDPNGPTGLQNPRTRTDRPSILDLKR